MTLTFEDAIGDPLVRDLLQRASAEVLAAEARAREFEARFLELRGRVLELAAVAQAQIMAAETRAKAAEDQLAAVMEAFGPALGREVGPALKKAA